MPLSIKCDPGSVHWIPVARRILSRAKEGMKQFRSPVFRRAVDPDSGTEIRVFSSGPKVSDFDKIIISGGRFWNYVVQIPGHALLFHTQNGAVAGIPPAPANKGGRVADVGTSFVLDGNSNPVCQMVWGGKELNGIAMASKVGRATVYDIDSSPQVGYSDVPTYPAGDAGDSYFILGRGEQGIAVQTPIPSSIDFQLRLGKDTIAGTHPVSDSIRSHKKNYFQAFGSNTQALKTVGFRNKVSEIFLSQGTTGNFPGIALSEVDAYQEIRTSGVAAFTIRKLFGGGTFGITSPDPSSGFNQTVVGPTFEYLAPQFSALVNANPIDGVAITPLTRATSETLSYRERVMQMDFYWVDSTGVTNTFTIPPFGGIVGTVPGGEFWESFTIATAFIRIHSAHNAYALSYAATKTLHNGSFFSSAQTVKFIDITAGSAVTIVGQADFLTDGVDPFDLFFPTNVTLLDASLPSMGIWAIRNITSGDVKFFLSDGTVVFVAAGTTTMYDARASEAVAYVLINLGGTIFLVGTDLSALNVSSAIFAGVPDFGGSIGPPRLVSLKDGVRVVTWANQTTGQYVVFEIDQAGAAVIHPVGASQPVVRVPEETRDSQQQRLVAWLT